MTASKTTDKAQLEALISQIAAAPDMLRAAPLLQAFGEVVGLQRPAVIGDYTSSELVTVEDGRTLAEVFGWASDIQQEWVDGKLNLISPIAVACRLTTRPFAWDAAAIAAQADKASPRSAAAWHLTPERGITGGITVPIHLPLCRTGSVGWVTTDAELNVHAVLEAHSDRFRLAALRFMDLVFMARTDKALEKTPVRLSEREFECLNWVALGRTDTEIGAIIHRSPTTVRFHVENAMAKLDASNRAQAVATASQLGLIHTLD